MITALGDLGYDTRGPVVRDGAIVPGTVAGVADLPAGYHDEQAPGHYRLERGGRQRVFAWAVGPGSWKAEFFPPTQELWRATVDGGRRDRSPSPSRRSAARGRHRRPAVRARRPGRPRPGPADGARPDPRYAARRDGAFVVAAECGAPAATCFCTSMGTGPGADDGFDLALTELDDGDGHRFVVRVGTERGAEVLSRIPADGATDVGPRGRDQVLAAAAERIGATPARPTAWPPSWPATSSTPAGTRWRSAAWPAGTAPWSARPASAATSATRPT